MEHIRYEIERDGFGKPEIFVSYYDASKRVGHLQRIGATFRVIQVHRVKGELVREVVAEHRRNSRG